MSQLNLAILLIVVSALVLFALGRRFIYWIPLYSLIIDAMHAFFDQSKYITYTRAVVLIFLFIMVFTRSTIKKNFGIFLFFIYMLLLLAYSPLPYNSLKMLIIELSSIVMLPLGFMFFKTRDDLTKLNRTMFWFILFWIGYVLYCTVFKIGGESSEKFGTMFYFGGFAVNGGLTVISFVIVLLPLIFQDNKQVRRRIILYAIVPLILLIVLMSLKRMALIIIIAGYVYYMMRGPVKFRYRTLLYAAGAIIILLSFTAKFSDYLAVRYAERGASRFQSNFYEQESRYYELLMVKKELLSFKDPNESLFGKGLGEITMDTDVDQERKIHIYYIYLMNSAGLLGLFLFMRIYWLALRNFRHYSNMVKNQSLIILKIMFFNLLVLFIISGFAGGLTHITFRGLVFLYIGAIMGIYRNEAIFAPAVGPQRVFELDSQEGSPPEQIDVPEPA